MMDIQKLLKMGFNENDVIKAYYRACRDVRRAAHKLIDLLPKSSLGNYANAEELEIVDIQRLIRLGFDEDQVVEVYFQSSRDLQAAAHKLVEQTF